LTELFGREREVARGGIAVDGRLDGQGEQVVLVRLDDRFQQVPFLLVLFLQADLVGAEQRHHGAVEAFVAGTGAAQRPEAHLAFGRVFGHAHFVGQVLEEGLGQVFGQMQIAGPGGGDLQAVEEQVFGGVGADQVEAQAVFDDLAALVDVDQAGFAVDLLAGRAGAFGRIEPGRELARVLTLPAVRLAALAHEAYNYVRPVAAGVERAVFDRQPGAGDVQVGAEQARVQLVPLFRGPGWPRASGSRRSTFLRRGRRPRRRLRSGLSARRRRL
jgi:hypothetical protein